MRFLRHRLGLDGQEAAAVAWSWLFFEWHLIGLAFAEIVLLWIAIAAWAWFSSRVSRAAGLLALPYLGWVTFASALTFTIWRLNA